MQEYKSRLTNILEDLGLSKTEAEIYLLLLKRSGASVSELAKEVGLTRQRIYDILENLSEKGLIYVSAQKPRRYYAVSPEVATSMLIRDVEKKLYNLFKLREEFLNIVRSIGVKGNVSNTISYEVTGRRVLISTIKEFINKSDEELAIAATSNESIRIVYEYKPEIFEASERGVKIYLLAPLSELPRDIVETLNKVAICSEFKSSARMYVRDCEEAIIMPSEGSLKERRWYDEAVVLKNKDISRAIRDLILSRFDELPN
ncbi:TrmB family transcriptional regulator [Ferroglobus sp.]|uniref:TrmB family transcriptional regulator n=1 Tax=Ferroglobus sp. TaxID=2614230 RepID=UPI0025C2C5BE|nr:TrmB family transcriptional regulator [Ferroglobus sp.]